MNENSPKSKARRAADAVVRRSTPTVGKKAESARSLVPSRSRRVISDDDQAPSRVTELVSRVGLAPDPYEDEPEARALALAPLLDSERSFGLLRLGADWIYSSGNEKLERLLGLPDPEATIQALACEEFVFLAKDIGTADSTALMVLASPAQLQATIDLDAWRLDALDRERFARWLSVCSQAGQPAVDRFVASQQTGVLSLFLSASVQIFENREDAEEAMPEDDEIFTSPDMAFLIAARPDDPLLPVVRELIASIYRIDVGYGRKVLRSIRWEMRTQLEEDLQFDRSRRITEYGFMSRQEARAAYEAIGFDALGERLDGAIAEQNAPRPSELRTYVADVPRTGLALAGFDEGRLLARAMSELPVPERNRMEIALSRLAYQLQSARATSAAEIDELSLWARHALATCDIGLARLSAGSLERAVAALRHVPVVDLFRAGHGLVVSLHHAARRVRRALGGDAALALLDGDGGDMIRGLVRGLPELAIGRGGDGDAPQLVTRPFESLAEIEATRMRLGRLRVANDLVTSLAGETPAVAAAALAASMGHGGAADLKLTSLVGTAIAWTVLDGQPRMQPLTTADLQRLLNTAFEPRGSGRKVRADLRAALSRALLSSPHVADDDLDDLDALLSQILERFDEELGGINPAKLPDARFVGTAVAVRSDR